MIDVSVYSALATYAGVTAIVGERIYPVVLPQGGTFPAISYQRIDTDPVNDFDGWDTLDNLLMQIECWSEGHLECRQLATQVKAAFAAATGFSAIRAGDRDTVEQQTPNNLLFKSTLTFNIWHTDT